MKWFSGLRVAAQTAVMCAAGSVLGAPTQPGTEAPHSQSGNPPIQVVSEGGSTECREKNLLRELRVYKDPNIFLANLGMIYVDPAQGFEALMEESPLLTTIKGKVALWQGTQSEFRNFGGISRLYATVDPRLRVPAKQLKRDPRDKRVVNQPTMIIPIRICGGPHDAYRDTLGFVLAQDLAEAQLPHDSDDGTMPPSTRSNPIPKLRN